MISKALLIWTHCWSWKCYWVFSYRRPSQLENILWDHCRDGKSCSSGGDFDLRGNSQTLVRAVPRDDRSGQLAPTNNKQLFALLGSLWKSLKCFRSCSPDFPKGAVRALGSWFSEGEELGVPSVPIDVAGSQQEDSCEHCLAHGHAI